MDYQEYIYWQGLAVIGRYPDIRLKARFPKSSEADSETSDHA